MNDWVKSLNSGKQIVILHPNAHRQHTYLWYPLQVPGSCYLRLEGEQIGMQEALQQVEALGECSGWLVLDELDRIRQNEVADLCWQLIQQYPTLRFVLSSRVLPVTLLHDEALRERITFMPVDNASELYDYTQHASDRPFLEVKAFGIGRVYLNGRIIEEWDGVLPRLLFFFFIDRGMVTRDEIFRTFWPNMSVKEATNVFHVTKRKINEVLGIDLTIYQSGYYRITDQVNLLYDVIQFNRTLQDSEVSETQELKGLLQDIIRLYQGDFLSTSDAEWVLQRREEMRQAYGSALYSLGLLYQMQGNKPLAETYFLRAFRHDPNEPNHIAAVQHLLEMA